MGPPSHMPSIVDRDVVIRRVPVLMLFTVSTYLSPFEVFYVTCFKLTSKPLPHAQYSQHRIQFKDMPLLN